MIAAQLEASKSETTINSASVVPNMGETNNNNTNINLNEQDAKIKSLFQTLAINLKLVYSAARIKSSFL